MRGILLDPLNGKPVPDLERLASPELAASLRRSRLAAEEGPRMMSDWPPAPVIGSPELIYRYTVTGAAKASIDTGADTPDAGSNDWTNGDLLEVWFYVRTDQAVQLGDALLTFNNDTGSTQYVNQRTRSNSTSVTTAENLGAANIDMFVAGDSFLANGFSVCRITVPNYSGTVGLKVLEITEGAATTSSGNGNWLSFASTYRSTSAITRLAMSNTSTNKFKIGSQLMIYKRIAS